MALELKDATSRGDSSFESGGPGPRSLTSAVFEAILSDILRARLLPGQKLQVNTLAERFSVSFGAVREALSRLVSEGFVDAIDQKGFWVSRVSVVDLAELTETRVEIEGLALRRSIEAGEARWARDLQAAFDDLSAQPHLDPDDRRQRNPAWAVMHERFHDALVAACPLTHLLRFRRSLFVQAERYRNLAVPLSPSKRDAHAEHRVILEAALHRDVPATIEAMRRHLTLTMDIVLQAAPILNGGDRGGKPRNAAVEAGKNKKS